MSMQTALVGAVLAAAALPVVAAPRYAIEDARATADGVKTAVAEYAATMGAWPSAADPSVVVAPAAYASQWVERLDLAPDGVIEVTLKASVGGGRLRMRPQDPDPFAPVVWRCESPDLADVGQLYGCEYTGTPTIETEVRTKVGGVSTAVAEFRVATGNWPAPGYPGAVDPPLTYAGPWVARIDLVANGVVRAALTAAAGGGTITFTPNENGAGRIYWVCTSAKIANVANLVPGCAWTP